MCDYYHLITISEAIQSKQPVCRPTYSITSCIFTMLALIAAIHSFLSVCIISVLKAYSIIGKPPVHYIYSLRSAQNVSIEVTQTLGLSVSSVQLTIINTISVEYAILLSIHHGLFNTELTQCVLNRTPLCLNMHA